LYRRWRRAARYAREPLWHPVLDHPDVRAPVAGMPTGVELFGEEPNHVIGRRFRRSNFRDAGDDSIGHLRTCPARRRVFGKKVTDDFLVDFVVVDFLRNELAARNALLCFLLSSFRATRGNSA
jgi:hypothetical protein